MSCKLSWTQGFILSYLFLILQIFSNTPPAERRPTERKYSRRGNMIESFAWHFLYFYLNRWIREEKQSRAKVQSTNLSFGGSDHYSRCTFYKIVCVCMGVLGTYCPLYIVFDFVRIATSQHSLHNLWLWRPHYIRETRQTDPLRQKYKANITPPRTQMKTSTLYDHLDKHSKTSVWTK